MRAKCNEESPVVCKTCHQEIDTVKECGKLAVCAIFMGEFNAPPDFFCAKHIAALKENNEGGWYEARIPIDRLRRYRGEWQVKWANGEWYHYAFSSSELKYLSDNGLEDDYELSDKTQEELGKLQAKELEVIQNLAKAA